MNIMTEGFMRKEPLNSTRLHEHLEVVVLFTGANWIPLFEKLHGYDEEVIEKFSLSLTPHSKSHATISFRGLTIEIILEFINKFTSLPLGLP